MQSVRQRKKHCMISLMGGIRNIQRTSEYNKKAADSQIQRINQWLPVRREGEGPGTGGRSGRHRPLGKTGSRMRHTAWGREPVFCNNDKCSITFTNYYFLNNTEKKKKSSVDTLVTPGHCTHTQGCALTEDGQSEAAYHEEDGLHSNNPAKSPCK